MFGMESMSGAVKPLADVPEFTGILTKFSNPILGLLAGMILTAVIQSSSASVGILQALCVTGAVGYSAAIPIIMGQNIGTCITALLSAIGAKKNAKRAAMVHLYFNIIGTVVFMVLFYAINAVVQFPFMNQARMQEESQLCIRLLMYLQPFCYFHFQKYLKNLQFLRFVTKRKIRKKQKQQEWNFWTAVS